VKPDVVVRVQGPVWEAVLTVPGAYGDAGRVAGRLRMQGLAARRSGDEVLVNANHVPAHLR
jgi:hypothetical protein